MVDDEPTAPEDDYDLLTHYEAGKRLADNIEREQQRCGDAKGSEAELHRSRLAALEHAVRRHRDYRPADDPTFFNSAGVIERVHTSKSDDT